MPRAVICHLEICATCRFFERLAVSGCLRLVQQQADEAACSFGDPLFCRLYTIAPCRRMAPCSCSGRPFSGEQHLSNPCDILPPQYSYRSARFLNGLLSADDYCWSSSRRPTLQGIVAGRGIGCEYACRGTVVCHLEICAICRFVERFAVSGCLRLLVQQQQDESFGNLLFCQCRAAQAGYVAQ